jgi:hypothetical protein
VSTRSSSTGGRGRRVALASLIGAGTGVAVGVTLSFAGDSSAPPSSTPAERKQSAVVALAPDLPELVQAFDRPQVASDVIPGGDPLEALKDVGSVRPGETPRLSRRLDVAGDARVYAWPATDAICYAWAGASVCSDTALLDKNGVLVGTSSNTGPEVDAIALARNGIGSVTFRLADGHELDARLTDNAAVVSLPEPPAEASWTNPDGSEGTQRFPR